MKEFGIWFVLMAILLLIFIVSGAAMTPPLNASEAAAQRTDFLMHMSAARSRPAIFKRLEFEKVFWNNLRIGLLTLLGAITWGLLGCAEIAVNGFKIGTLYAQACLSGIPPASYLKYVLPHAVFEYSGYLTAQAAALCYARQAWKSVTDQRSDLKYGLFLLAPLSLLLICAGAWIEVYVTPFL